MLPRITAPAESRTIVALEMKALVKECHEDEDAVVQKVTCSKMNDAPKK